jgi:hypothetical protein
MQPFPVFGLTSAIEQDLAKLHDDRARRRAAEGYPVEKPANQPSHFMRFIALFTRTRQPKTSNACGD